VPDAIEDAVAASLPVAYLTAQITLTLAGFSPGKTVLAPAIGGSVGTAVYQLARAQGAGKVISTAARERFTLSAADSSHIIARIKFVTLAASHPRIRRPGGPGTRLPRTPGRCEAH
jgi:NADPH:quinone reductase-like Zn-dependent oxidoreductase